MKTLYIESKLKDTSLKLSKQEMAKLPKSLILAYSIQYKGLAKEIKLLLESNKIKINNFQQVLGCTKLANKNNLPILLVGAGRFHATNLYLQASEVYLLENNRIIKIPESEIERLRAKKKASLVKFLSADTMGILVTTKPGQENLDKAINLKIKLEKQGKKAYIFVSNNIDLSQFENFNIQSWVNTGCSGLSMDNSNIINIEEIPK